VSRSDYRDLRFKPHDGDALARHMTVFEVVKVSLHRGVVAYQAGTRRLLASGRIA